MGRELVMINNEFPTEMLDRFIFAVEGRRSQLYCVEKPLTQDKAMEFLGIKKDAFYGLTSRGLIKAHRFPGLATPFYFPSEMYEALKKH